VEGRRGAGHVLSKRKEIPLIVPCDRTLRCSEIWRKALEAVDFERIESKTTSRKDGVAGEAELSGKLGWRWLAEATSRFKGSLTAKRRNLR
jgi:hypothetical protein